MLLNPIPCILSYFTLTVSSGLDNTKNICIYLLI